MMKLYIHFLKLSLCLLSLWSGVLFAQDHPATRASSVMLTLGLGSSQDTYLTPYQYQGVHLGLIQELIYQADYGNQAWANQFMGTIDLSSGKTKFGSGGYYQGSLGFELTSYRMFSPFTHFEVGVGPSLGMDMGFIYNRLGGNNLATAQATMAVGAGALATYRWNVTPRFPLYLRYQINLPVASMFFAPHYGQSYYEIFTLGNRDGIIHFGSFHNRIDVDQLLTIDIPLGRNYLRVGYSGKLHQYRSEGLKTRIWNHDFVLGFTREFTPYHRRRAKEAHINPLF